MTGPGNRRALSGPGIAPVAAALYAVALVVLGALLHRVPDYGVETDFLARFVPAARAIQQGTLPIDNFHGPLYPLVLALIEAPVGDFMLAGQLINSLCAAAIVFFGYRLFRRWFGAGPAAVGAGLVALNPHLVQYAYTPCNDLLFAALVTLALDLATRGGRRWYGAAIAIGCASLVRFNGIALLPAFVLARAFAPGAAGARARLARAAAVLALGLLVLAPYGLWSWTATGEVLHHAHHKNLAWTFLAPDGLGWEEFWGGDWCAEEGIESMADVVRADPAGFGRTYLRNLATNLWGGAAPLVGWPVVALALVGFGLAVSGGIRGYLPLLLAGAFHVLAMGLVVSSPRFMLPLVVVWIAFALHGLSAIASARGPRVALGLGCLLLLATALDAGAHNRSAIAGGPRELREAAERFASMDPEGAVLARKPHFAYFAGLTYRRMPFTRSLDEFLAAAAEDGAEYVYFGEIELRLRPDLAVLAEDPDAVRGHLELILEHPVAGREHPARLYRVVH